MLNFLNRKKNRLAFYEGVTDRSREVIADLERQLTVLNDELDNNLYKKTVEAMDFLLQNPNMILCDLQTGETANVFVTFEICDKVNGVDTYEFHLHEVTSPNGITNDAYLYFWVESECIEIHDVISPSNSGWGTLLMKHLIEYAKMANCKTITGRISSVDANDRYDENHYARLIHFYSKFNFSISDVLESGWRNIRIDLLQDEQK